MIFKIFLIIGFFVVLLINNVFQIETTNKELNVGISKKSINHIYSSLKTNFTNNVEEEKKHNKTLFSEEEEKREFTIF